MADENENNEEGTPVVGAEPEEFAPENYSAPSTPEEAPEAEPDDEGFTKKKARKPRTKRVIVPKDSASFFRARAKQFRMFPFTQDGNLQVPELAGQAAKVIELPHYRLSTEAELEENTAARRQELENVEREYDEMLRAYKDAQAIWKDTGVASDVIAAQRELARLDALRSQLRSPLRWTKEFKGLSVRQLMPDLFYEVRKVGYKCYGMRLRSNPWEEMTKIGEAPTPAIEEDAGSGSEEEEEEAEAFVFFSGADDPEHGALSPDTMIEFVVNSTKYTSIIQAYEVERITQLGRRKDLGSLFLRAKTPAQVRALAARVTGDVENPRELWITILKALVAQHPKYAELLRSTGKDTLVYASPKDTRWGIGLSADDPAAMDRSQWKGENLLGQAWQAVRVGLPAEAEAEEAANVQEGGSGETKYTEHAFTREEGQMMRKNILKGYYRKKVQ